MKKPSRDVCLPPDLGGGSFCLEDMPGVVRTGEFVFAINRGNSRSYGDREVTMGRGRAGRAYRVEACGNLWEITRSPNRDFVHATDIYFVLRLQGFL